MASLLGWPYLLYGSGHLGKWSCVLCIFTTGKSSINQDFSRKTRMLCSLYSHFRSVRFPGLFTQKKTFRERKPKTLEKPTTLGRWTETKVAPLSESVEVLPPRSILCWGWCSDQQHNSLHQPHPQQGILNTGSLSELCCISSLLPVLPLLVEILLFLFPHVARSNFKIQTYESNRPGQVKQSARATMRSGKMEG